MMCGATMIMPDRFLQPEPAAGDDGRRPADAGRGGAHHLAGRGGPAACRAAGHLASAGVIVGGAAVPHTMIRAFDEFNAPITHAWGMTETHRWAASPARRPASTTRGGLRLPRHAGPFPPLVAGRIVDDEGNELPWDGETSGELEVSGPWITGAYHQPDGNVSAPDKFHDGWLRTGDVATISPDGYMRIVDRTKDIIKTGGEWISSVELENAVMSNPVVLEATVIGVPDAKWDERPFVLAVVASEADADIEAHKAFLADLVPRWRIPERWSFVTEIPKTSVGKFDKKAVRSRYAEGGYEVFGEPAPE